MAGRVVMAFKSGFCNEYSTVRWETMPGLLRAAAGFHYQEFSSLKQPLALKGDRSRRARKTSLRMGGNDRSRHGKRPGVL